MSNVRCDTCCSYPQYLFLQSPASLVSFTTFIVMQLLSVKVIRCNQNQHGCLFTTFETNLTHSNFATTMVIDKQLWLFHRCFVEGLFPLLPLAYFLGLLKVSSHRGVLPNHCCSMLALEGSVGFSLWSCKALWDSSGYDVACIDWLHNVVIVGFFWVNTFLTN